MRICCLLITQCARCLEARNLPRLDSAAGCCVRKVHLQHALCAALWCGCRCLCGMGLAAPLLNAPTLSASQSSMPASLRSGTMAAHTLYRCEHKPRTKGSPAPNARFLLAIFKSGAMLCLVRAASDCSCTGCPLLAVFAHTGGCVRGGRWC